MDIKQIEKEIKQLQGDMKLSLRRTVDDAIRIGELLKDAKSQKTHGEFMPWCERQGIGGKQTQRYMQLAEYAPKIVKMTNLDQAYQLIESEENKRKREEFEAQTRRVNEYKKTGKKPDDWDKATDDYRLRKEQEDADYERRKREHFEKKQQEAKERAEKLAAEKRHETIDDEALHAGLQGLISANNEKERLLSKMRLTGNNAKEPIYDALLEYLLGLDTSTRLEACHNIIKFCKGIAAELQKQSVKSTA